MNNLQLIEDVLNYIDKHLADNITFEIIAEKFGYSAFHFHRIFSTVTGQTITDYLKKRRLLHAFSDLLQTKKTVTEICYDYAFGSIQTFNRTFKATFDILPSEARKKQPKIDLKSVKTIISGYKKRINFKGEYVMEPKFIEKDEFILVGSRKHTKNGWQVIGEA